MNVKRVAGLCAAAVGLTAGLTAFAADDDGVRQFLDQVNRPVALAPAAWPKASVLENRKYRRDDAKALADVYLPRKTRTPAAVVVLVHGGMGPEFPVRPKNWGSYRSWGRLLASSGFVAVTFNHRLGFPAPMIEEAASDLDSLRAFVRANARAWGADPGRVAIVTYSAGGMLLASALREPAPELRSLVAFYPIVDLTVSAHLKSQLAPEQLERHTLGQQLGTLGARMPPLLLVRCGRDQIPDLLAGVDRFAGQAMAANAPVTIVNLPEAAHGFDNQALTPLGRAALEHALEFLRATTRADDRS